MKKGLVVQFYPGTGDSRLVAVLEETKAKHLSAKVINFTGKEGNETVDLTVSVPGGSNTLVEGVTRKDTEKGRYELCPVKEIA